MASNNELKPGRLDQVNGYTNSMAHAMEKAFKKIWPQIMYSKDPDNPENKVPEINDHMRMIFIAISQGVVEHLIKNMDAFKVTVKLEGADSGRDEVTVDEIDREQLHKHLTGKGVTDTDNGWGITSNYLNHTHPITESDTHKHVAYIDIIADDTLIPD